MTPDGSAELHAEGPPPVRPLAPQTLCHTVAWSALARVAAFLAGAWLIYQLRSLLLLCAFSLMLVVTFEPLVRRLQGRTGRSWAITSVLVGAAALVGLLAALILPPLLLQARSLVDHLPAYVEVLEKTAQRFHIPLHLSALSRDFSGRLTSYGPQLWDLLTSVMSGLLGLLTVIVLSIYLLIEGPLARDSLVRLLPREERLAARRLLQSIGEQVGHYMRGQLLTSVLAALFSFILLAALRVPEPLALAFLMAIADVVPIVGLIIGTLPAVMMALSRGGTVAVIVAVGYVVYHLVETNVLVPRIYGRTLKLPLSVIIISMLAGATLLGVAGVLLALPVAAAVPAVARFVGEWREHQEIRDAERPR